MKISIIIPTLNEGLTIGRLLKRLLTADNDCIELIIVDGGSTDETLTIAANYNVNVIHCSCSRAKQMNTGAIAAKHNILYFVHADTLPPIGYLNDAIHYLQNNTDAVCYKSSFEGNRFLLRLNAFFSQFYWLVSRGGDQSLFIKKKTFEKFGMYDESLEIMEEYPLIEKLMQTKKLAVIPKPILISSRKYDNRSWFKVSRANYVAFTMYRKGMPSKLIKNRYLELLGRPSNN